MQGKTVVITGATSGIGLAAARELARLGARIVFTARDEAKARAVLQGLARANPNAAHDYVLADLTTIAAMKTAGAALAAKAPRIDVLANNAGAIFDHREVTADGLEKTFAVNHMTYFVLTEVVRHNLAPRARIVSTASEAHRSGRLDLGDLQSSRRFSPLVAYGTSKLCNILWTCALSRRLADTGITANCFHPGGVNSGFADNTTGLLRTVIGLVKPFMLTPQKGADTLVWLASAREIAGRTGGYWVKRKLVQPSATARDPDAVAHLWAESARIAGWPQLAV